MLYSGTLIHRFFPPTPAPTLVLVYSDCIRKKNKIQRWCRVTGKEHESISKQGNTRHFGEGMATTFYFVMKVRYRPRSSSCTSAVNDRVCLSVYMLAGRDLY